MEIAVWSYRAAGAFDVKLTPQADGHADGVTLGRMTIDIAEGKHAYAFTYTVRPL